MIRFNYGIYRLPIIVPWMLVLFFFATFSKRVVADPPATKELTNSLGMKFTTIVAGEFLMGATTEEIAERKEQLRKRGGEDEGGDDVRKEEIGVTESEGPQHRVSISKNYWLGTYEVTQHEFQAVMGFNPSIHTSTGGRKKGLNGLDTQRHPVDHVSWNDAAEFCRQLSGLEEEVAAGRSYRLPTEAEWEYACRAGTTTKFFWGEEKGRKSHDWTQYPKVGTGKRATTVPVGSLKPNPWGLHDMPGNAREWCADWYDPRTYAKGAAKDPTGPSTGDERVVRGGMANFFAPAYRSAARRKLAPDAVNMHIGFRVVCEVNPVTKTPQTTGVPAQIETQLRQKGIVRSGALFVIAEGFNFSRYTTTLERMRIACFRARREVEDAKLQLRHVSAAKAGVLQARIGARETMRYSDTWREHRCGVIARNIATDALALVNMSQQDVELWLADAQEDFDTTVSRFAEQCKQLREMHQRFQIKQRELAADATVQTAIAAVSAGGKTNYRFGLDPTLIAALKRLEHEETALKQLQAR